MGLALTAYNSKSKNKSEFIKELENAAKTLESTRPTAANLFWATSRILDVVKSSEGEVSSTRIRVIEEAKKMANEDVENNMKIGENGTKLLNDGDTVLTHCKWSKRPAECWSIGYCRLWNCPSTY
jgi:methylthioribose-1-phosphate isomerase